MLSELAHYAQTHGLAASPGFKPKAVKGYFHLSAAGDFLGIQLCEKGTTTYAPDIGAAANGTRYCNFLIEKAKIPLNMVEDPEKDRNIPTKHDFYLSMLADGGEYEPKFHAIAQALKEETTRTAMILELGKSKLKGGDPIGFVVDGISMERSDAYLPWWSSFRTMFAPAAAKEQSRCLITGELTTPLDTVPKVSGLLRVGGHTSGDAFLCFDKDAFQSYGLKKSANASVSEEAMAAVNAALTELLAKAPVFGGAKLVHWYAGAVPEEIDLLTDLLEGLWDDDITPTSFSDSTEDEEAEQNALISAKRFFASLTDGKRPQLLSSRYYIMPLSGAGGRMMVRGWYEGSFENLYQNIDQWFTDLRLVGLGQNAHTKPPKLKALCIRLLKPDGRLWKSLSDRIRYSKEWYETLNRVDDEMPNLSGRILTAIIDGNPLPDEIANRALHFIQCAVYHSTKDISFVDKETLAFQLLKAWLVRRQRQRGESITMGENVNTSPKTTAYCCGQLMAVYGAIQSAAMPDVNVSVIERYYAAASTTPAFVLGKLAQLSVHHLAKLEQDKAGLAVIYRRQLDSIASNMQPGALPRSLNLEQQAQFALGYYQQRAAMFASNEK